MTRSGVRVGINALYLIPRGVGGTEIYLRELLIALATIDSATEYFVFTNLETASDLVPKQPNFYWKPQAVHARIRPARILWEQVVLPIEAARYRLDVLFNPGFTAPVFSPCRQVTVFHDLQHKRHPEHFRWFDLPFWRLLLWAAAHRSHRLIAVSEATRADLLHFYRVSESRVAVIPHGVEPAFSRLDRSRTENYLLCVSTLHPHKNMLRLIRAFGRKKRDFPLVLAGLRGFHAGAIEALIAEMGLQDSVRITGWVPREELYQLYAHARAFIYPSTFEGFGMPVLEALAAGIPTACSDIPPLREVAGDATLFFDPQDEDAIAAAIERVMSDAPLRKRLAQAGPERARPFTWERAAEQTRNVLLER
ncbi:MAG TPA: glycosyltransferase family 1 protein [Bryobacteraceae bacterium]|nr:glycosyltransferase family 1 protein [Bryobacteraceae bacterium]